MKTRASVYLTSALSAAFLFAAAEILSTGAYADDSDARIQRIEDSIKALQTELAEIKAERHPAHVSTGAKPADISATTQAASVESAPQTTAVSAASAPGKGLFYKSDVKVTLGGYIEAAAIARSANESADVGSKFNAGTLTSPGIPFSNNPNSHISEFRGSARQSRLSLLAQGKTESGSEVAGYIESDFLGSAVTANSVESNSYTPRLRQGYLTYDDNDDGWHLLAGQAWSLITLNKVGIVPRQEDIPMTIDAQYVTGFNWTRNWQLRLSKDFDKTLWGGVSFESPQAIINSDGFSDNAVMSTTGQFLTFNSPGGSLLNSGSNYSLDHAPDIIAKLAWDPGWGHYELYGLARFFSDRVGGSNKNTAGGGGGAAAILPIIAKKLDLQGNFLIGRGIGRYGSSQFSDVIVNSQTGNLTPISEVEAMVGLVAHPTSDWDFYMYGGTEDARKSAVSDTGGTFGYGNPNSDNTGCSTIGSTTCNPSVSDIWQGTAGGWWKFYQGGAGMMEFGASYSYTHLGTFHGMGIAPDAHENIIMTSLRYYPF